VFGLDEEEGVVVLLNARPTGTEAEDAADAASLCPSGALTFAED
jgi:ferredoxin